MENLKRLVEFQQFNPFRVPHWRLERARSLAERFPSPGRCSPRDDAWIKQARDFLIRWPRADDAEREELLWKNPGLAMGYKIYEMRGVDHTALYIEARLLAGQSFDKIGTEVGTWPDAVRWYEALFFDVLAHLHQRDWVTKTILIPPILRHLRGLQAEVPVDEDDTLPAADPRRPLSSPVLPVALPFNDPSMRYFAYFGGPVLVDVLIHGIASGRILGSPEDVDSWWDSYFNSTARRRSGKTMGMSEINKYNALELCGAHLRLLELDKLKGNTGKQGGFEKIIRSILDSVPWRAGSTPGREDPRLVPYQGAPGELRDDELFKENLPAEEVMKKLPPPRPRRDQHVVVDSKADFVQEP